MLRIGNILLDFEWNARLGYCGLAAVLLEEGQSFGKGVIGADTMGYVALEIVEGRSNAPTTSDIYSFGVLVLEIASGRRAYSARRYLDVWARDLYEQGKLLRAVDVRLEGILLK
ncbi:hypothetical protein GOP47_0030241 [Adiantum capillus-veneris]|nr:hypothetical protein GOP47_0030241 [Adiantum capillus-veneris]